MLRSDRADDGALEKKLRNSGRQAQVVFIVGTHILSAREWNRGAIVLASACLGFSACADAQPDAQQYPARPVRVVVPFPPGGSLDLTARIVSAKLAELYGTQFVIDERAGAGGNIAAEIVAKAAPDGYTLMQGAASNAINTALNPKLPFNFERDFTPIVLIASVPFILVAHPSVPAKSVKELIAYAKANPGKLSYGSAGNGTTNHLTMELFKYMTGTDIVHIPYKGGGPAMTDQLAGRVALAFANPTVSLPHIRNGKLRALGVSTAHRSSVAPDIPSVAEAGVPGFDAATWYAFVGPAGMPHTIVQRLNLDVNRILKTPDIQQRFAANGIEIGGGAAQDLAIGIRMDIAKWTKLIAATGIKAE